MVKTNKLEKMVKVTDDWFPCFEGNKIKIEVLRWYSCASDIYRVKCNAYGADDCGYTIEFVCGGEAEDLADAMFSLYASHFFAKAKDGIDKRWFIERGFKHW